MKLSSAPLFLLVICVVGLLAACAGESEPTSNTVTQNENHTTCDTSPSLSKQAEQYRWRLYHATSWPIDQAVIPPALRKSCDGQSALNFSAEDIQILYVNAISAVDYLTKAKGVAFCEEKTGCAQYIAENFRSHGIIDMTADEIEVFDAALSTEDTRGSVRAALVAYMMTPRFVLGSWGAK